MSQSSEIKQEINSNDKFNEQNVQSSIPSNNLQNIFPNYNLDYIMSLLTDTQSYYQLNQNLSSPNTQQIPQIAKEDFDKFERLNLNELNSKNELVHKLYYKFKCVFYEINFKDKTFYIYRNRKGKRSNITPIFEKYLTSYIIKFRGLYNLDRYYSQVIFNLESKKMLKKVLFLTLADSAYLFQDEDISSHIDTSIHKYKNYFESRSIKFEYKCIEVITGNLDLENTNSEPIDFLVFYPPNIYHNDIKYELIRRINPRFIIGEFEGFIRDEKIIKYLLNQTFLIIKKHNKLIDNISCYERAV